MIRVRCTKLWFNDFTTLLRFLYSHFDHLSLTPSEVRQFHMQVDLLFDFVNHRVSVFDFSPHEKKEVYELEGLNELFENVSDKN